MENVKYKLSNYNFFVENSDRRAIYNLVSNEFFDVNENLFAFLKESHANNKSFDCSPFDNELLDNLIGSGIIVGSDENELDLLSYCYNKDKYDDKFISLILYPTLKCNFDCHYCYEKQKNVSMSRENMDILKNYLINISKSKEFIATRWSGGEPLLKWKEIYNMSRDIINACNENGCNYFSSIVTNGSLLTEEIIGQMIEARIGSIQITLDGPPSIHDKVRYLKGGEGSFYKVLKSIELASKHLKIILRLNVDKRNFESMEELFKILSNSNINKKNVRLFCKPVLCSVARTPEEPVFSQFEFYEVEKKLLQIANEYKLTYSFHWGIKGRNTRCLYHSISAFLVDPSLKLYRCPIYIGGEDTNKIVGHIGEEGLKITNRREYLKSLTYSPFEIEECKTCKVLPSCYGKCPVMWEIGDKKNDEGCIPEKYTFLSKLEYSISNPDQLRALSHTTINSIKKY